MKRDRGVENHEGSDPERPVTALSDQLQHIVSENVEASVEAIGYLRRESKGRPLEPIRFTMLSTRVHSRPLPTGRSVDGLRIGAC